MALIDIEELERSPLSLPDRIQSAIKSLKPQADNPTTENVMRALSVLRNAAHTEQQLI